MKPGGVSRDLCSLLAVVGLCYFLCFGCLKSDIFGEFSILFWGLSVAGEWWYAFVDTARSCGTWFSQRLFFVALLAGTRFSAKGSSLNCVDCCTAGTAFSVVKHC